MGEDSLRNRKDNGPENLAPMRKLALNPLLQARKVRNPTRFRNSSASLQASQWTSNPEKSKRDNPDKFL